MEAQKIFQTNRQSSQQLLQIASSLSEKDLLQVLPNGWTIAETFGHLAFWDQRVIHVIELAQLSHTVNSPNIDIQINEVLVPFLKAIPPLEIAKMAVSIAEKLDAMLENCEDRLLVELYDNNSRWVERFQHRNEHLADIEACVNKLSEKH